MTEFDKCRDRQCVRSSIVRDACRRLRVFLFLVISYVYTFFKRKLNTGIGTMCVSAPISEMRSAKDKQENFANIATTPTMVQLAIPEIPAVAHAAGNRTGELIAKPAHTSIM